MRLHAQHGCDGRAATPVHFVDSAIPAIWPQAAETERLQSSFSRKMGALRAAERSEMERIRAERARLTAGAPRVPALGAAAKAAGAPDEFGFSDY